MRPKAEPYAHGPSIRSGRHGQRAGGPHPTTRPNGVQRPIMLCEATLFGKDSLRMAGIVQMLHRHKTPHDKYPYANPEGIRQAGNTGDQTRSSCTVSTAVPGPCATVLAMSTDKIHSALLTCLIWPILPNLLTATHYIVSVHNCI